MLSPLEGCTSINMLPSSTWKVPLNLSCSFLYFAICKERLNSGAKIRQFSKYPMDYKEILTKKKYFGKINSLDTICLQSRTITNTIFLSPSIIDVFHKGQTLYIAPKLLYTRTCQNMKVIHNSDMFLYVTYFIEK